MAACSADAARSGGSPAGAAASAVPAAEFIAFQNMKSIPAG